MAVDRTVGNKNKRFLTGHILLDRKLKKLKMTAGRRVVSAGMRKQGQHLAKKIKAAIPSRYKMIRQAIGWRSLKLKDTGGEPGVKTGAAVGKQTAAKKRKQIASDLDRVTTAKAGVGIGSRNIHWWFLGTKSRKTKKGANRGRMAPQVAPVKDFANREKASLMKIMKVEAKKQLAKELAKLKAKG